MRALVLTGPPAAGKSTIGRLAAQDRPRAAFIDIDDVRHLVVSGHAAPWEGEEGRRRAAGRPVHLTPAEFRELHARQAAFTAGDIRLDTTRLPVRTAAARVRDLWHQPSA
jgi:dephospho-CoA kinase